MGATGSQDKQGALCLQPNSAALQHDVTDDWSSPVTSTKSNNGPSQMQPRPPSQVRAARSIALPGTAKLSVRVPTDGVAPSPTVPQRATPAELARIASSLSSSQERSRLAIEPGADLVTLLVYVAQPGELALP